MVNVIHWEIVHAQKDMKVSMRLHHAPECELYGRCEQGKCICSDGYGGVNCTKRTCTNDCSNHGECQADLTCKCNRDWEGELVIYEYAIPTVPTMAIASMALAIA